MNLDAPTPAAEEQRFGEDLIDLLYDDQEVVDREFEALIAAVWPPSPRGAPAEGGRGSRGATWPDLPLIPRPRPPVLPGGHPRPVRERSPPAEDPK